jgi:predicted DCC family thiol-disulfide oxidoreductase YuxK
MRSIEQAAPAAAAAASSMLPQVANNRYNLFGRTPSCRLSDPRFEERFLST